MALAGFGLISSSGILLNLGVFYTGVVLLGLGTGLSTVANLSLMLDMTTAEKVGLFIGAWGMSNAISRLMGSILAGAVRDLVANISGSAVLGYVVVFSILGTLMLASLLMLRQVNVDAFRKQQDQPSLVERIAIASEA
jgi:BCD family chlorophyll transporter-like MFS transporter